MPSVSLRSRNEAGGGGEPSAAAVSLAVELWSVSLLKMEYQHPAHMTSWWGIIGVSRKQQRRRETRTGWNRVLTLQQRTTTAMERWDSFLRSTAYDDRVHILDDNNVFAFAGDVLSPIDDEINEINIWRRSAVETHGTCIILKLKNKSFFSHHLCCVSEYEPVLVSVS